MGSAGPLGPGPGRSCPSPALWVHTLTLRASPGAGASVMLSTGGQKHPAGGNLTLPVGPQHLPCEPPPLARVTVPGPGTHRNRVSASVARSACCSSRHVAGTKSSKAVFHGVGSDRSRLGPGDRIQPGQAPSPLGTQLCGFGSWLVKPGGTASCCLICALVWQKPSRPAGPHPPQPGDPCPTSGHSFLSRPLSHPLCHLITLSPPAAPAHLAPA